MILRQSLHQVQFCPDRPSRPGRRGLNRAIDHFSGSDNISAGDDIVLTLWMYQNFDARDAFANFFHCFDGETSMN